MSLPRHVAIIMDGNGRWAARQGLSRTAGHKAGLAPARAAIEHCSHLGVQALTLFAFSSENWGRPREEVSSLMGLFVDALDREVAQLHANGVRLRFIGERRALSVRLQARIAAAEQQTADNGGLRLQVAVSYGGRWDLLKAVRILAARCADGSMLPSQLTEEHITAELSLAGLPDPDLFVRTGGERRISNFLLWNLAYTELYFTDRLWPEFDVAQLDAAFEFFAQRERRFGLTATQLQGTQRA